MVTKDWPRRFVTLSFRAFADFATSLPLRVILRLPMSKESFGFSQLSVNLIERVPRGTVRACTFDWPTLVNVSV